MELLSGGIRYSMFWQFIYCLYTNAPVSMNLPPPPLATQRILIAFRHTTQGIMIMKFRSDSGAVLTLKIKRSPPLS